MKFLEHRIAETDEVWLLRMGLPWPKRIQVYGRLASDILPQWEWSIDALYRIQSAIK